MASKRPVTIADGFDAARTTDELTRGALSEYALSMFAAQVLEERIGLLLYLQHKCGAAVESGTKALEEILSQRPGATLGRLIGVLKKTLGEELGSSVGPQLDSALAARNFVAHGYFRLNWSEFLSAEGLERAKAKLLRQRCAIEKGISALAEIELRLGENFLREARLWMGTFTMDGDFEG